MAFENLHGYKMKNGNTGLFNYDGEICFSLLDVEVERGGYSGGNGSKMTQDTGNPGPRARTVRGIMMKKGEYLINAYNGYLNGTSIRIGVVFQSLSGERSELTDSGWQVFPYKFVAPYDGIAKISFSLGNNASFDDETLDIMRAHIIGNVQFYKRAYNEYGRYKYQFLPDEVSLNKEGYTIFDPALFTAGAMQNGVLNPLVPERVATPEIMQFDYPLQIVADDGYRFGVHIFTDAGVFDYDPGWLTAYTLPANKKFKIVVSKVDETGIGVYCGLEWVLSNHIKYRTKLGYDVAQLERGETYNHTNNTAAVPVERQKYNVSQMSVTSTPDSEIGGVSSNQGFAICNGVIFQLYSNDKVELIDLETGTSIAVLNITSAHGDIIDFSNEYYADGDEFPLAYITADTTPAKVYVNRITRTGTELVKTYIFPADKTGYYAGHTLDPVNKIIYQVGYTENSYYQDPNGTNYLIVSVWDLKDVTDNGDNTFTPAFIKSFNIPFYTTLQGQAFFNGLIVAVSSHWSNAETKVLFIDPGKEAITTLLDDFPTAIKNSECEGIAFVPDGNKYYSVIKPNNTTYWRVDFS